MVNASKMLLTKKAVTRILAVRASGVRTSGTLDICIGNEVECTAMTAIPAIRRRTGGLRTVHSVELFRSFDVTRTTRPLCTFQNEAKPVIPMQQRHCPDNRTAS
jgi:hypothetical protein